MVKLPTPERLRGVDDPVQGERALELIVNACLSDVTGHTAMAVPRSHSERLPVDVMPVGGKWYEATVPRVACALEGAETYPPGPNALLEPVGRSW